MHTTRTIAITGANEQDAARIVSLLERHRSKLSSNWESAGATEADLLLVDIESTYGQMDWLRARSRGRLVIAYTSAIEPMEPEFSLRKPAIGGELVALLNRIGEGLDAGKPKTSEPMRAANAEIYEAPVAAPLPTELPPAPIKVEATEEPQTYFVDELLSVLDEHDGPVRLVAEGLPSIIVDPARQRWYAGVGLKPLTGWCKRPLRHDQPIHLDAAEFAQATEILQAQPYARLVWFARLVRSEGTLDAGLPSSARYRLTRWPQVEREFPKHFRIATSMMRGTGTLEEIAAQSTAGVADVADFINAYHALGYVECEATLPVTSPNDRTGLLRRVRESLRN